MIKHPRCPYCHEHVTPKNTKYACHKCMAWHHNACWEEGGKCSACGNVWKQVSPGITTAPAPVAYAEPFDRAFDQMNKAFKQADKAFERANDLFERAKFDTECLVCGRPFQALGDATTCGCEEAPPKNSAFLRLVGLVNRLIGR